jgi:hypothetical protein
VRDLYVLSTIEVSDGREDAQLSSKALRRLDLAAPTDKATYLVFNILHEGVCPAMTTIHIDLTISRHGMKFFTEDTYVDPDASLTVQNFG